ncbi:restriction endonuclease subunit S [Oceanobacillus sp. ISL-73]|uniref:restriction endonuclease subunit S n=1 Tax=Oceanobacillus sp. ISL-73 TaxID=2819161 RepID=UPI0020356735|nr:restriction endonuclease subunit S [Oceanobacillus sp. ISL-73]
MNKKEKLMLVPKLRFPEFNNENDWKKRDIGDFLKESRIKGNKGDTAKKLTVKLWGQGVFEKKERLKGSENTQYFRRKSGQFIYSKLDFLNQAFGIVPNNLDGYESTVDLPCFDVNENMNVRFLLEYVQRTGFYKKYGEMADGGRRAKRIQVDTFLGFPIYTPNLKEQQKIASFLSSLDGLINGEEIKFEALKAHKKGLIRKLFPAEGKTVPEWRFPEFRGCREWDVYLIKDFAKVTTGNKDTQNKVDNGKHPFFVRSQAVERIDSYTFDCEAILTSGDGVGVGKNFHYIDGKFDFHQRVYCIYDFSKSAFGMFVFQYFSEHFNNRVMKLSAKNSVDSVRKSMITEMPIIMPNIAEQHKISECLSSIDDLITAQAEKVRTLKLHKKGLIQELFPSVEEEGE